MKHPIRSSGRVTAILFVFLFTLQLAGSARFGPGRASAQTATNSPSESSGTHAENIIPTLPTPVLSATPSTSKIAIAEPFTLLIETIVPQGSRVTWEALTDTLGGFDVLKLIDSPDVPVSSTHSKWTRLLTLETIQLGQQTIPPIQVSVQTGDDANTQSVQRLQTEPILIDVQSVLDLSEQNAPNEFRDIAGTITLPPSSSHPESRRVPYLVLTAVAVALLAFAIWAWRRSKNGSRRWCLRQLQILKQRPVGDASSYIETSNALKEILRVSLLHSGPTGRPLRTTQALIDELFELRCTDSDIKNFSIAFQCADRLKFSTSHDGSFSAAETAALKDAVEHADQMIDSRTKTNAAKQSIAFAEGEDRNLHAPQRLTAQVVAPTFPTRARKEGD